MVRLMLKIKAELENVTDLQPAEDFDYFFRVKCTQCNEVHPKLISINRREEYDVSGGKGGKANFVWKCGLCKREANAKFEQNFQTRPYSSGNEQLEPFLTLDCRNLEFVGFDPKGTWKCVGVESRSVFDEVDLTDGEWADYDEKGVLPVGVSKVEGEWSRA